RRGLPRGPPARAPSIRTGCRARGRSRGSPARSAAGPARSRIAGTDWRRAGIRRAWASGARYRSGRAARPGSGSRGSRPRRSASGPPRRARRARGAAGARGKPGVRPAAVSTLVNVLGESLATGLGQIDVADRVDPETVSRGRVEARQDLAVSIEDADRRPQLAHVGHLLRVEVDVGRPMDIAPLGDELPARVEHLDAAVLPVADVDESLRVDPQAVGQVELAGLLLARRAPRREQGALRREAMHAAVAVAVRDVEIARRRRDHLGGL